MTTRITHFFASKRCSSSLTDSSLPLGQELISPLPEQQEQNTTLSKKPRNVCFSNIEMCLDASWRSVLESEIQKPYFRELKKKLEQEAQRKTIFPPKDLIFNAFELTPWESVKVVILGQDPYHDVGQAQGLCFSVPKGIAKPSSLQNIFKEIRQDLGEENFAIPSHGNLSSWAEQGVLLLNTVLTVRAHEANSHKDFGWQRFTDAVIAKINSEKSGVIFVLWGKQAQLKSKMIDSSKHHILSSAHPSGLSAHRGFFGCKHFSKVNEILLREAKGSINWASLNFATPQCP